MSLLEKFRYADSKKIPENNILPQAGQIVSWFYRNRVNCEQTGK